MSQAASYAPSQIAAVFGVTGTPPPPPPPPPSSPVTSDFAHVRGVWISTSGGGSTGGGGVTTPLSVTTVSPIASGGPGTVQVEDSVAARATKSLSLTALPPAHKTVDLTWNASSGIGTTYNVKRSIFNGGPYTTIVTAVAATNYNDANVKSGLTYYYVVSAAASNGSETANSNQAFVTIP